jgi:hypothetical protein
VPYVFNIGTFSCFKLASSKHYCKPDQQNRLYSEQCVNASHFSTHQSVKDTITEVALSAAGREFQNCLSRLSEFLFLLIILFCFFLLLLSTSFNSVLSFCTLHSPTCLGVREFFLLLLHLYFLTVNIPFNLPVLTLLFPPILSIRLHVVVPFFLLLNHHLPSILLIPHFLLVLYIILRCLAL